MFIDGWSKSEVPAPTTSWFDLTVDALAVFAAGEFLVVADDEAGRTTRASSEAPTEKMAWMIRPTTTRGALAFLVLQSSR